MENMNQKYKINKSTKSYYGYDEPREYTVGFFPHKSGKYRIEIDSQIEEVSQFSTAIQVLGLAQENDEVEIHLQSPGGNVDSCGAFLHAMNKCEAQIHIVASGGCHSAATHILLLGDSFELADNFNSLIHNGQAGSIGNINEYHAKSDFDKEFIRKQYWQIYEGFISKEEFDGVMRGDQIWLDAQQWCDRAEQRIIYYQNKIQSMHKAAQKATRKPRIKKVVKKAVDKTSDNAVE